MAAIPVFSLFSIAFLPCILSTEPLISVSSDKDVPFAKQFLKMFHYISPLKSGNHDFKTAVQLFQEFMHLPITGNLDKTTITEMKKPRCGVPDIDDDVETNSSQIASKRYIVHRAWDRTDLTYGLFNTGNDMSVDKVKGIFKKAFKMWSDKTVLRFTYVADARKANIKIRFVTKKHPPCDDPFDGPGDVMAHASFPPMSRIHIDDDEHFTDGTYSGKNLLAVAVHEIGHVIGIGHSKYKDAIMYPEYGGYDPKLRLHADDINAASELYGGPTVIIPATTTPPCVDHYNDCPKFAHLCDRNNLMEKNCPYTCYVCRFKCEDNFSKSLCERYKTLGLCNISIISSNCRKTCSTPGSNCGPPTTPATTTRKLTTMPPPTKTTTQSDL